MSTAAERRPLLSPRERDFYTWALENARAIREGRIAGVDWAAVAEELEDMSQSERRALERALEELLAHLIEWSFHPKHRSHVCTGTIK